MSVCSIIGDVNSNLLVKMISARLPHGKDTVFLFKINVICRNIL